MRHGVCFATELALAALRWVCLCRVRASRVCVWEARGSWDPRAALGAVRGGSGGFNRANVFVK